MRLHDTAARAVEPFVPRGDVVSLYVCGITPYDGGHLGHAFTYHTFDVLARRLASLGHEVRSVRNVTDVDDDMLRVARERHVDWKHLGVQVTADFDQAMAAIDILPLFAEPLASEHVPKMVEWVDRLVTAGYAYDVEGWVYFEVARFTDYGSLSHLDEHAMLTLSRERGANPDDPRKRAPLDFVLWQPSLPDEPHWPSPWGDGRPGWHIECSVLATDVLGAPIDIHGGGDDLIYPHHEGEVAQAHGAGVNPYVRRWMHVAMVRYQGEKMSKSLGNLVFVRDLLADVSPATIRLLLAAHHYRVSWEYTPEMLHAAESRRRHVADAAASGGRLPRERADALRAEFLDHIDDDLDTPEALRVVDAAAVAIAEAARRNGGPDDGVSGATLLAELLDIIGAASAVTDQLARQRDAVGLD